MTVIFKADSDFSKVLKDFERLQRENVRLQEKMRGVTKESSQQDGIFKSTFGGASGQLRSMVAGYFSLQGAISLVNAGLAEQKRISAEIHRVQMTAADAQAEVIKNLGDVNKTQAEKFLGDISEISKKQGAPSVAPVFEAAAATLSGVAGDQDLTKTIVNASIPFFRNKPAELPAFAGAVGDLATIAGAKTDEEVQRIIGLVLSTQQQARIVSLDAFKNAAPALAAVSAVDTGGNRVRSLREGGALFAAIGGAIKDPEGALTKTATSEVATALSELLPERDVIDAEGQVKRKGTGLKTLGERLAAVQASPDLQRRFFETGEGMQAASFRGPIMPVIKQLIADPTSEAAQRFRSALTKVTDDPGIVRTIMSNLENATPQLETATFTRRSSAVIEQSQLGSTTKGTSAAARDVLEKAFDVTNNGYMDSARSYFNMLRYDISKGDDPIAAAEAIMQQRIMSVLTSQTNSWMPGQQWVTEQSVKRFGMQQAIDNLTPEGKENVRVLQELLAELRSLREVRAGGKSVQAAADLRNQREGL